MIKKPPLDELSAAVGWSNAESVKALLYHDLNRVKGYGIRTQVVDGQHVYYLVYPEGITAPPPHVPKKSKSRPSSFL